MLYKYLNQQMQGFHHSKYNILILQYVKPVFLVLGTVP